jgi:peptidoglycan/LPS O-acetylase OafA/YrhL
MPLRYIESLKPLLDAHHAAVLIPVAGFLGTLAVAALSFRFVERPFLRLKSTLAPTRVVSRKFVEE